MEQKTTKQIIAGIKKFKQKIGVQKAIVFGSFATGQFNEESDIDLILVSQKFQNHSFLERLKGLWLQWDLDLPVDFICYTQEEFNALKNEVSLVSEALKEGFEV